MGIKFADIIALAKSGYTVSDVKELMQLSDATTPSNDETEAPQDNTEPAAEDPEEPEQEEVDYKTLYEQEQEKVKRLQAVNRNQNAQTNEKTDQEILMDLARDFM
jgi:DNA-binding transcriptional MerR regulator